MDRQKIHYDEQNEETLTGRQADRQTGRQAGRQADRRTDRRQLCHQLPDTSLLGSSDSCLCGCCTE